MSSAAATSNSIQMFFSRGTEKACDNLIAAVERIPLEKHAWKPATSSRSAIDQAAECALLNASTVKLLTTQKWPEDFDFNDYYVQKDALAAKGWDAVKILLQANSKAAAEAIAGLPDEHLGNEILMPWGPMSVAQICSYPYWNMTYHEGQINYIASMIGCLD